MQKRAKQTKCSSVTYRGDAYLTVVAAKRVQKFLPRGVAPVGQVGDPVVAPGRASAARATPRFFEVAIVQGPRPLLVHLKKVVLTASFALAFLRVFNGGRSTASHLRRGFETATNRCHVYRHTQTGSV